MAYTLTTGTVAELLHVSTAGVLYLVSRGHLRYQRTSTGQRLFEGQAVKQLLEQRLGRRVWRLRTAQITHAKLLRRKELRAMRRYEATRRPWLAKAVPSQ